MKNFDYVQLFISTNLLALVAQFASIFLMTLLMVYFTALTTRRNTYINSHAWVWAETLIASLLCFGCYRVWLFIVFNYPRLPATIFLLIVAAVITEAVLTRIDRGRSLIELRQRTFFSTDFRLIRRAAVFVTILLVVNVFSPAQLGTSRLRTTDLKDPKSLILKLRDAKDPVSQYIHGKLSPGTQQMLAQFNHQEPPNNALGETMTNDLNLLLLDESFYQEERFRGLALSDEIKQLLQRNRYLRNVPLINRLLLETAYPNEIDRQNRDR